jgi:hypothetical protein
MTIAAINEFKADCNKELGQPIKVSTYINVDYSPLEKIPDISLQFIVGGGWSLSFDYRIVGGPDDGKRVTLLPWRAKHAFIGFHEKYNGTYQEAENAYGYTARPAVNYCGTLHIATVMFLRGMLTTEREHLHAQEVGNMYDRLHAEFAQAPVKVVEREDVFDDYRGPNPGEV